MPYIRSYTPTGTLEFVSACLDDGDTAEAMLALRQGVERFNGRTIVAFHAEIASLVEVGEITKAQERIDAFLHPKWRSVADCRDAYDHAMAATRARAA